MQIHIFSLTCAELAAELNRRYGKGHYHARALCREIFKAGTTAFASAPEFVRSPSLTLQLCRDVCLPSCRIVEQIEDGVLKFASALDDGHLIESVIIPSHDRTTLCVSSQAGCRMACSFCTTGAMGFIRNLSVEEIVWQVYAARFLLSHRVDNIVFMGMGEPLDNLDNVVQALRVISDQRGLDIPLSHITLSTAGHADGLARLAALNLTRLRLAVSLNAADDVLRSSLMPINNKYPLSRLRQELLSFPLCKGGIIFVEYVLLAGINDSLEHARSLARFLDGLPVRVNVIAYNGDGSTVYGTPPPEQVRQFCSWLAGEKIFVRARQSRGQSIMAACGQLGASLCADAQRGDRSCPDHPCNLL